MGPSLTLIKNVSKERWHLKKRKKILCSWNVLSNFENENKICELSSSAKKIEKNGKISRKTNFKVSVWFSKFLQTISLVFFSLKSLFDDLNVIEFSGSLQGKLNIYFFDDILRFPNGFLATLHVSRALCAVDLEDLNSFRRVFSVSIISVLMSSIYIGRNFPERKLLKF